MKFLNGINSSGQYSITFERSEYDAFPPVTELTLDARPEFQNPEREAVASVLLFGKFCGGDFQFSQNVGPATASAIRRFCFPLDVSVAPLEYYPKPLPIGTKSIVLSETLMLGNKAQIVNLPSDKFNGGFRSHDSLVVASNSFMLKKDLNDFLPSLGIAVLFAEDFEVDEIIVKENVGDTEFERCRALLSVIRLGLTRT